MWHFKTEHDTCWCRRLLPADGCESFQLGAARRPLPPELSWAVVILGQAQWALRVPPITQVKSEDPQASWPWAGCFPCHSRRDRAGPPGRWLASPRSCSPRHRQPAVSCSNPIAPGFSSSSGWKSMGGGSAQLQVVCTVPTGLSLAAPRLQHR